MSVAQKFIKNKFGNIGLTAAFALPAVVLAIGVAVDYLRAEAEREKLQQVLDGALLAAVHKTSETDRRAVLENMIMAQLPSSGIKVEDAEFSSLSLVNNADGSASATLDGSVDATFTQIAGYKSIPVKVRSTAILEGSEPNGTCVWALGSTGQDVLINSGAKVQSTKCEMDTYSVANPAFIMNSGSTIKFTKFCVKGTQYIKNGGTLDNLETGCNVTADPYAGKLPEPPLPSSCTTSGYFNSSTVTMPPGMHCDTGFNGSPTITFEPGLHIIKGRMIINSGATVIADGVTFYFPDTNSEIRANGALTFTGRAPKSGTYKGILMFEKTSDASNNTNKTQYIFNGSNGETLEGIIYLPNRNVTYNSTTNVTAKISLVVNQMIFNSANWLLEPYEGGASGSGGIARLIE